METPDKIYLGIQDLGSGYVYNLSLDNNGEQEYIRKDALMAFVNKKLQESADRLDFHANKAYAEIFDKLNSI